MEKFDCNDSLVWLIKDNRGNFAHKNSIGKSGINTWLYISYKTYDRGCRGNTLKQNAINDLEYLNMVRGITNMDYVFHIEQLNRRELIIEHRKFKGKNIVCFEKIVDSVDKIVNF